MKEFRLTTFDNPFDPFDSFDDWLLFDIEKGYGTCEYLARIARTSDGLSDEEYNQEIERAIDSIIAIDPFNMYKKVSRNVRVYEEEE